LVVRRGGAFGLILFRKHFVNGLSTKSVH
jgi:hypothetical protein